jgi:hypothetical protein
MSEIKHTRGPWSLELDDVPYDGGFETYVVNSENGGICMMNCPKDDMEVNGRLIAAAPDLYEALEALCSNPHINLGDLVYYVREREGKGWDGPAVTAWGEAVEKAKAAIKKAKGEQS